jgi:glutathione S-transferase
METFVVHGIPGSPYVRSALLGLEEKGLPYRLAAMGFGDTKGETHLKLHPFGRIPAFERGDLRFYETQAMLRYLERLAPSPVLVPADPRVELRMNQLIGICDWYVIREISSGITFPRLIAPKFGMPVDEAAIAAALPGAKVCVAEVARLMGQGRYLVGDAVSLADLMLAPHLCWLPESAEGRELLAPYPTLSAWIDRMNGRPSMIATTWERLNALAAAA